jgi:hypothetical protein
VFIGLCAVLIGGQIYVRLRRPKMVVALTPEEQPAE